MPEATTVNPAPARAGRPPPLDAERVLELAARSLFDVFDRNAKGTMVVDRNHRIVWISEGYQRFLPALGHDEAGFVGQRVEEVVPNTLIGKAVDSGQPILVDLLTNQAGTFLGSRLPPRNDAGEVIGTVGYVLLDHPESTTQPLVAKFAQLQHGLGAARREIAQAWRPKHSIASFIGSGAAGRRASRALVSVNIAAVPDTLLEAEFFGVAPGACTGAERKGRDGKFKLAAGGTLLSAERAANPAAAAARTAGRHRSACPCAGRRHCAAQRHGAGAAQEPVARRAGAAGRAAVARQHSRAAQRARTGHADDR